VGAHAVVRWQSSQDRLVTKWFGVLPVAMVPLWQVLQVPGTTPVWLNTAPSQVTVVWQESQERVVGRCVGCLPVAAGKLPLWQVLQVPGATVR